MASRRVRVVGDLFHPRLPPGAVYVGRAAPGLRASRYANPHRVARVCRACDRVHDQPDAVTAYAHHLAQHQDLVVAARRDLAGADLACWCRCGAGPCHADVLLLVVAGDEPRHALAEVLRRA